MRDYQQQQLHAIEATLNIYEREKGSIRKFFFTSSTIMQSIQKHRETPEQVEELLVQYSKNLKPKDTSLSTLIALTLLRVLQQLKHTPANTSSENKLLASLPPELFGEVSKHLATNDLLKLRQLSKEMHSSNALMLAILNKKPDPQGVRARYIALQVKEPKELPLPGNIQGEVEVCLRKLAEPHAENSAFEQFYSSAFLMRLKGVEVDELISEFEKIVGEQPLPSKGPTTKDHIDNIFKEAAQAHEVIAAAKVNAAAIEGQLQACDELNSLATLSTSLFPALFHMISFSLSNFRDQALAGALNTLTAITPELKVGQINNYILATVCQQLTHDNWRARVVALTTLTAIAPKLEEQQISTLFETVCQQLTHDNWRARVVALDTLTAIAPKLKEQQISTLFAAVCQQLTHDNWRARVVALTTLTAIAPKLKEQQISTLFAAVCQQLTHDEWDVRAAALTTLTAIAPKLEEQQISTLFETVCQQLTHDNWRARVVALDTLTAIAPKLKEQQISTLFAAVCQQLTHDNWRARVVALTTLTAIAPKLKEQQISTLFAAVCQQLTHDEWGVRAAALDTLTAIAPKLKEQQISTLFAAVCQQLTHDEWRVRVAALDTLTAIAPKLKEQQISTLFATVCQQLTHDNWRARVVALTTLTAIAPKLKEQQISTLFETVCQQLTHDNWRARVAALKAILSLPDNVILPKIRNMENLHPFLRAWLACKQKERNNALSSSPAEFLKRINTCEQLTAAAKQLFPEHEAELINWVLKHPQVFDKIITNRYDLAAIIRAFPNAAQLKGKTMEELREEASQNRKTNQLVYYSHMLAQADRFFSTKLPKDIATEIAAHTVDGISKEEAMSTVTQNFCRPGQTNN